MVQNTNYSIYIYFCSSYVTIRNINYIALLWLFQKTFISFANPYYCIVLHEN